MSADMFANIVALLALTLSMSTASVSSTPGTSSPKPTPTPKTSCASLLERIEEARPTLRGLQRSRARLLHKQRKLPRGAPGQAYLSAMLTPIDRQTTALAQEIDRMEREYLRCVEHVLDTSKPAT